MTETFQHYTVMLKETVDGLNIKPDGVYVDCTLGGAGHSEYLLSQLSSKGHLYAFDQDQKQSIMPSCVELLMSNKGWSHLSKRISEN